jgi:hypothetical protein
LKKVILLLSVLLFAGCGYKPTVGYAQKEIKGLVYVDLHVNINSFKESIFIKDTMNRLIAGNLKGKLVKDKSLADTIVYLTLGSVSHSVLSSDTDGYVSKYRTTVRVNVRYKQKEQPTKSFSLSDYSDYAVATDGQLSDQRKNQAINDATSRAMKKVFTKIALHNLEPNDQK